MAGSAWVAAAAAAVTLASAACQSGASAASAAQPSSSPSTYASPSPAATPRRDVVSVVAARSIDARGNPAGVTQTFDSATDRQIVIAIPCAGAPVGTSYAYTRYLDGRYLDSRSAQLTQPSRYFIFRFTARPGQRLVPGHFRYQVYRDRSYVGAVEFAVR